MSSYAELRFAIIGNSGSGKSTLAAALCARHTLPCLDLDTVAWVPGEAGVPREAEEARRDVRDFCTRNPSFVVEGCYEDLIATALEFRPTLVFVDVDAATCERHCRARPFEPHKYDSPAAQDEMLGFLLQWVRDYYMREGPMSRAAHLRLFEAYAGPKLRSTTAVMLAPDGRIVPGA